MLGTRRQIDGRESLVYILPYFQLFKNLLKLCKLKIQYRAHNLPTTSPHIEPDDSNPYPPTNRASSAMFYWNNALPGNGWAQLVQRWMPAYPCVNRARWYAADLNSKGVPTLPTDYNWHVPCNCSTNRSYWTEQYYPVIKPVALHSIMTYGIGYTV